MDSTFTIKFTERAMIAARDSKQFTTYSRLDRLLRILRRQFSVAQCGTPVAACVAVVMSLYEKDGNDLVTDKSKLFREQLFEAICKGAEFHEIAELLEIPDSPKVNLNRKRLARALHVHLRKHLRYFTIPTGKNVPTR